VGSESEAAQELYLGWRLGAGAVFIALNGFFVAAEFAMVRARATRIERMAEAGNRAARAAQHLLTHLDHYLSACQLGITATSIAMGWLVEPAVAAILIRTASALGWVVEETALVHGVAFGLALLLITLIHMVIGEQAPKVLALRRAEAASLVIAYPLRAYAAVFRPIIWLINTVSNALVRLAGVSESAAHDSSYDAEELREILKAASRAGHISVRQEMFGENVLGLMKREVRHLLVPRVEAVFLSMENTLEENLAIIRQSGHSRFPLCEPDLDAVRGIVHSKDVFAAILDKKEIDLLRIARPPVTVPDTQPVSRFILQLQAQQAHCAVVVDEHGTTVGLAFLEDALEEIVGPIYDEFDLRKPRVSRPEPGIIEMAGNVSLPVAAETLDEDLGEETDTIGGFVVASLGRLPSVGDTLEIAPWKVTVMKLERGRIARLRFESAAAPAETAKSDRAEEKPASGAAAVQSGGEPNKP